MIRAVEQLTAAGVLLPTLREGSHYSTPTGRKLAGIFAAPTRQVRALREGGKSINDLVRSFGVSRATIYRAPGGSDLDATPVPATAAEDVAVGGNR